MSGSTNNFTPASRNWQAERDYGAYVPSSSGRSQPQAMFPLFGSPSFRSDPNATRGAHRPWQPFEETTIAEPQGPPEPYVPPTIQVLDGGMRREIFPRQRQRSIILDSPAAPTPPSRFMNQWRSPPRFLNEQNVMSPSRDSRLTPDEQQAALKKLKKDIYNPGPKKLIRGLSLYYRDNNRNIPSEKLKEKDNDGKSCAVCLEDFEPREKVMLTPCNHMFHEDCIVPWIKSNGQCPVCRFALCERMRTNPQATNLLPNVQSDDLLAIELMAVIRAMEEAFLWGNTTH